MTGNYRFCPRDAQLSLRAYVKNRKHPGGLLKALLENRVGESKQLADASGQQSFHHIIAYVRRKVPALAKGSTENVTNWLNRTEVQPKEDDE